MDSPHLQRARLLMEQSRYDMAEQEIGQALVADPHNAFAHALMAMCRVHQNRAPAAIESACTAIGLAPDFSFTHYVHAMALDHADQPREAMQAIEEAIRLDPDDATYWAAKGSMLIQQRKWREALEAADRGLQVDARHVTCANVRAMALVNLGRRDEAARTIDTALERDPDNAVTHANQGWALLHQGDPRRALEHFREALRLEPSMEWARKGIVEAMKARNPLYRAMLAYFLWIGRLSDGRQWLFLLGTYLGYRVLATVAKNYPDLRPFVIPLIVVYALFVFLSWTAGPMFNLMLRFNRFGRHVLDRDQIVASNWFAGLLGGGVACAIAGLATGKAVWYVTSLGVGLLSMPLSGLFDLPAGKRRRIFAVALAGIILLGLTALGLYFIDRDLAISPMAAYFAAVMVATWVYHGLRAG